MLDTNNYRKSDKWLRLRLLNSNLVSLTTNTDIEAEYWGVIEYISEIEEAGVNFLISRGYNRKDAKQNYKVLNSYVRQAKNYYLTAKSLQYRSAPLMYYYSFLNLAKAFLLVNDIHYKEVKIKHGLIYKYPGKRDINKQNVISADSANEVFPRLYKLWFGQPLELKSFSILTLLGYCSEIAYQYEKAKLGNRRVDPALYVGVSDSKLKTSWALLGLSNFDELKKYKKTTKTLTSNFSIVSPPQHVLREMFDMNAWELANFTFLQSNKTLPWLSDNVPAPTNTQVFGALKNLYQVNYFSGNFDFFTRLPYQPNNQKDMDESMATYIILFFLSNLVRYWPSVLESYLLARDTWLIEGFIRSCPHTLLRAFISRIVNEDVVITSKD